MFVGFFSQKSRLFPIYFQSSFLAGGTHQAWIPVSHPFGGHDLEATSGCPGCIPTRSVHDSLSLEYAVGDAP